MYEVTIAIAVGIIIAVALVAVLKDDGEQL